jgi:hypothetical protein
MRRKLCALTQIGQQLRFWSRPGERPTQKRENSAGLNMQASIKPLSTRFESAKLQATSIVIQPLHDAGAGMTGGHVALLSSHSLRGQAIVSKQRMAMVCLDPLDKEILERALDATDIVLRGSQAPIDLDSDEELEAELRRELIEILFSGVTNPVTLRDVILAKLFGAGTDEKRVRQRNPKPTTRQE